MANSIYYNRNQIEALARLAAADYAAACTGPTVRSQDGGKEGRGMTLAQRAKALGITEREAKGLGLHDETMAEVALRLGLTWAEAQEKLVDLATASWEELSPHWQQANIDSAMGMIALMEEMGGEEAILALDLDNEVVRVEAGTRLHQLWLTQSANDWAIGGPLDKPFVELDPVEQAKDIQQLRSLQKWLRSLRG